MRVKPKFRCTTRKSIGKLAKILQVPNTPDMQDWEWVISDSHRINKYLSLYKKDHMDEDDRIGLMETIIQDIEDLYSDNHFPPKQWKEVKQLIRKNSIIHQYTVFYWGNLDEFVPGYYSWCISKEMRKLYLEVYKKC